LCGVVMGTSIVASTTKKLKHMEPLDIKLFSNINKQLQWVGCFASTLSSLSRYLLDV
jgi:hypothetical protein